MSYIGNPPVNGVFRKLDTIAASFNGSTTSFNLTSGGAAVSPGLTTNLIISLGGIIQEPNTAYTVNGSVISFTAAPPAGTSFWGIQLGDVGLASTPNQAAMTTQVFTATAGQTTFTVAGGYTAGQIQVLRNGVQLVVGVDVTATNGTTFVLTNAATAGDTLVAVIYTSFIVANAVAKSGDTMSGSLTVSGGNIAVTNSGVPLQVSSSNNNAVISVTSSGTIGGYVGANGSSLSLYSSTVVEGLRVNSAGYVTTPLTPAFSVVGPYLGGTNPISVGAGSAFVILWAGINLNDGSCYSSSTGRFTAPIAGRYLFSASLTNTSTAAGPYIVIRRNGSSYVSAISYSTAYDGSSVTAIMSLAANDYVDVLFGSFNVSSSIDLNYSNFCGHLIG